MLRVIYLPCCRRFRVVGPTEVFYSCDDCRDANEYSEKVVYENPIDHDPGHDVERCITASLIATFGGIRVCSEWTLKSLTASYQVEWKAERILKKQEPTFIVGHPLFDRFATFLKHVSSDVNRTQLYHRQLHGTCKRCMTPWNYHPQGARCLEFSVYNFPNEPICSICDRIGHVVTECTFLSDKEGVKLVPTNTSIVNETDLLSIPSRTLLTCYRLRVSRTSFFNIMKHCKIE